MDCFCCARRLWGTGLPGGAGEGGVDTGGGVPPDAASPDLSPYIEWSHHVAGWRTDRGPSWLDAWTFVAGCSCWPSGVAAAVRSPWVRRVAADLELLKLRSRRGHDLRRTFVTLALVDGADRYRSRA